MSELYPDCDPYGVADVLTEAERGPILRLRSVLESQIQPLLAEHWEAGTFPAEAVRRLQDLQLMHPPELAAETPRTLYHGFRIFEMARCDASIASFYTAQAGLFRTACRVGGSAEQFAAWDPRIQSFEMTGVFCLTEPEHGSDIAGGLSTAARKDGDDWIIDGVKRWIGGALTADYLCIFARDVADAQVKAFLVPREAEGVTLEKIHGKTSLRIMQNAHITLSGVRVPESARLQNCNSFKDVAAMLRVMRSDVSWIATGLQAGAYEAALRYTREREQFGRPIAGFQLVQEKLARMLGNVTASLSLVSRLAEKQQEGAYRDEDSALAKMWVCSSMRETVALAREVAGGNGITLAADVARFHADAEAVYSYEGTHEVNSLIVGRAVSGRSAFV
ncbi:glutaryl-CoA dehydrogenase [Kocuria coralli]|uniref:Glutaryl-CoA dehydrogenase n=1 Tax=Kocuria coralli TaxID=1461025 RepID=A0A5J5KVN8_9MICC|nr:acyl-CoA dehydrogenase family protein [Kocuria coralli]KAA9393300.1 glutaryl-CoA dehydrogenase [Kocuria coralli]